MLGSYMEDIGITPQQFEEACGQGTGGVKKQFQQGLFEQVNWFIKNLMCKFTLLCEQSY